MTTERVTFLAECPTCGRDAWWHATRGADMGEGSSGRVRVVCQGDCPDSDPAIALAAVITGRNDNPLTA